MKRTLLALLCVLGIAQAAAATLTEEKFTKEFVTALRAALPDVKVTVPQPLEVHVADAEGNQATAYLQNAFNEVTRDPSRKKDVIERYVASIADAGSTPDWIKPANIVPVIKDRAWLEEAARGRVQAGAVDAPAHIVEDFNEDLVIVYAEDTPRNTRYFSLKELEEAGVARKDLRELAIANLDRILPEIEFHAGENISMLVAGADYVPSLLLIDELWRSGQVKADGDIVVAVPSRDMLLFTGSRNTKGIAELQKQARKVVEESSYSLTSQLFVYRDGKFQRFTP
jgi:uncharacterized protein YtpQ (UPF0354 family)